MSGHLKKGQIYCIKKSGNTNTRHLVIELIHFDLNRAGDVILWRQ
jgi:hypothetical protein